MSNMRYEQTYKPSFKKKSTCSVIPVAGKSLEQTELAILYTSLVRMLNI